MASKQPEWLKYNDDNSADITLSRAVVIAGVSMTSLRMREPLVSDQELAAERTGSDATREIAAFADLCGLTPADVRQLPARDWKRLQTAYLGFID